MSAPSTSGLSVELLLRVIDVNMVTLLYFFTLFLFDGCVFPYPGKNNDNELYLRVKTC